MPVSSRTALEVKHVAMRSIGRWAEHHREQAQRLYPSHGTIGVGGADFDHLLKAVVGEAYLRVLHQGGTPQSAHAEAVTDGDECIRRWNSETHKTRAYATGPYELQRWNKAGELEADHLHRHFLSLMKAAR